jgi:small subunit ribosomal protein S6
MPKAAAYDLFVLIDADIPEERRTQIVQSVRDQIDAGAGTLKGDADWGVRKLAFEIGHRGEAQYHLFQLEAEPELLGRLRHSLAIEDGVVRHRILRLDKGAPEKVPKLAPTASRQPAPLTEQPAEQPEPEPAPEGPRAEPAEPAAAEPGESQTAAAEDAEQPGPV